ncbi:Rieske (2Fe-2S) protein [Pseudacidobacterium ailaaui]|uniref:Rieske (2Fe-2S) protein n=1 Tax=Pseudacidobacterium ailaaui TaxID=1382359 RepID=UPI00047A6FF0|nr:Rieske (2Fe-2S) protein [Pseudacidobacterium ailaaui]MBX6361078.1 Rieske (2Fe-2S) protein [Pseudacidobacterium ailaaui]MCL6464954.1 Rieske (2Fe-2S) protein [Pseudacidobacterium ailaaui]MDI3253681.1 Rieske (2Fe-2S) protein [Bacillota bacterium]
MQQFVRICGTSELPASGAAREIASGDRMLCVANEGGVISVMDNVCPHRGGPLGQGMVEAGKIICPWHAWAFDLKTGAAEHTPLAKVQVYEAKIEGEDVLVKL